MLDESLAAMGHALRNLGMCVVAVLIWLSLVIVAGMLQSTERVYRLRSMRAVRRGWAYLITGIAAPEARERKLSFHLFRIEDDLQQGMQQGHDDERIGVDMFWMWVKGIPEDLTWLIAGGFTSRLSWTSAAIVDGLAAIAQPTILLLGAFASIVFFMERFFIGSLVAQEVGVFVNHPVGVAASFVLPAMVLLTMEFIAWKLVDALCAWQEGYTNIASFSKWLAVFLLAMGFTPFCSILTYEARNIQGYLPITLMQIALYLNAQLILLMSSDKYGSGLRMLRVRFRERRLVRKADH